MARPCCGCLTQLDRAGWRCPLLHHAGASTRFYVDGGVTLRLLRQPKRAPLNNDPMFAGPGGWLDGWGCRAGQGKARHA